LPLIQVGAPGSCRVFSHIPLQTVLSSSSTAGTSLRTALVRETVLPDSSAAGLYSYMHIHVCIIISYNICAHFRCICIFTQHRSAEPVCQAALLLPGLVLLLSPLISESVRPAAVGSCPNTAHARDGDIAQQLSCRYFFQHRSSKRRCWPAALLRVFIHVSVYVSSCNITYMHTPCVYVYLRNTATQIRVCQAALLLPGLVVSPLLSESVRPAAAGSCAIPLMRETVLPSSSAAGTSFRTAHPRYGVARQLCCGSLFIYAYPYMYIMYDQLM
jgi:hypothetical protein